MKTTAKEVGRGTHLAHWDKSSLISTRRTKKKTNDAKAVIPHRQTNDSPVLSKVYFGKTTTQIYCWVWCHMLRNIPPLNSSWLCQLCRAPASCLLSADWLAQGEAQGTLMLRKHYTVTTKTLVSFQHCSGHQSITRHHMGCYMENELETRHAQYKF